MTKLDFLMFGKPVSGGDFSIDVDFYIPEEPMYNTSSEHSVRTLTFGVVFSYNKSVENYC